MKNKNFNVPISILMPFVLTLAACAPSGHSSEHASKDHSGADHSHSAETQITTQNEVKTMAVSILQKQSPYDFETTIARVKDEISKRPLNLFAVVPHSAGAQKAGLELAPSTLFIFGNPKGGAPLMARNPEMGIELPLKVHVFETDSGVKVNYTDIAAVVASHGGDPAALPTPKIADMLEGLVGAVVAP